MLIDVKYLKDWQLGSKKNMQDSVVKQIIFTTQKVKFSFMLMEHQTTKPERIPKLLQIVQRKCLNKL